jgi:hypothetical protein
MQYFFLSKKGLHPVKLKAETPPSTRFERFRLVFSGKPSYTYRRIVSSGQYFNIISKQHRRQIFSQTTDHGIYL